ncbi:MAG: aldo/keto reductase [Clostridia bacterium]|nr:aldo/keto reductase [Clostridia bacterium]
MLQGEKKLGFGCMRLPMIGEEVDEAAFCEMIDAYMAGGFRYFDTAQMYLGGKSETALRSCLTSRYPREKYLLTDKLSPHMFEREEDIRPAFEAQLKACGVEYFDFYLMHAQNADLFEKYKRCNAYETAFRLKEEGKVKHVGFSFHDNAEVLDRILTEYPQLEVVQIQFNYLDYEDVDVQSRKCYEVCRKHNKPILIMEPVKGGALVNLPKEAQELLEGLHGGSPASYALRFAAQFEGVAMVLSGMGDMNMMRDNMQTFTAFRSLDGEETAAIYKVAQIIREKKLISCTGCRYCVDGCPKTIPIPEIFACKNEKTRNVSKNYLQAYQEMTQNAGKASDCINCGKCEKACPQHLPIRELLAKVKREFER